MADYVLYSGPLDIAVKAAYNYFSEVQVEITDPGKSNFLEFHVDELRMLSASEFLNAGDPLWRGVFGYVAFGWPATRNAEETGFQGLAYAWRNAGFVNWKYNCFRPELGEQPGTARIWMRKGVKAHIYCWEKTVPMSTGAKLLTPGLINSNQ